MSWAEASVIGEMGGGSAGATGAATGRRGAGATGGGGACGGRGAPGRKGTTSSYSTGAVISSVGKASRAQDGASTGGTAGTGRVAAASASAADATFFLAASARSNSGVIRGALSVGALSSSSISPHRLSGMRYCAPLVYAMLQEPCGDKRGGCSSGRGSPSDCTMMRDPWRNDRTIRKRVNVTAVWHRKEEVFPCRFVFPVCSSA